MSELSYLVNILRYNFTVQVIVSFFLGVLIIYNYKKFLFWIPFIPFSGIWAYNLNHPQEAGYYREYAYLYTLLENPPI